MSCVSLDIKSTLTALFYWLCVKLTEEPWRRRTHRERLLQQSCPKKNERKKKRDDQGRKYAVCVNLTAHETWSALTFEPDGAASAVTASDQTLDLTLKANHCWHDTSSERAWFLQSRGGGVSGVGRSPAETPSTRPQQPALADGQWQADTHRGSWHQAAGTSGCFLSWYDEERVGGGWGGRGEVGGVQTLMCHAVSDNWTTLPKQCFNKIKGRLWAFGGRLLCRTRTWMRWWPRFIVKHQKQHTGCTAPD